MRRILLIGAAVGALMVLGKQWPELRRYAKMRTM
ncbi:MAG: DUF6893 family small protein [Gemmatimonadota bacterium]